MKERRALFRTGGALLLVLALSLTAASCRQGPEYTARVVDADTGEPVEGAVYLAVRWKKTWFKKAWFEGPSTEMATFQEGYTDGKGWIKVRSFWTRRPLAKKRTLTVYKPGYAMWNQEYVFPGSFHRRDFNSTNREIRLEKWKDEYSYGEHSTFLIDAFHGRIRSDKYMKGKQLFYELYADTELKLYMDELSNKGNRK